MERIRDPQGLSQAAAAVRTLRHLVILFGCALGVLLLTSLFQWRHSPLDIGQNSDAFIFLSVSLAGYGISLFLSLRGKHKAASLLFVLILFAGPFSSAAHFKDPLISMNGLIWLTTGALTASFLFSYQTTLALVIFETIGAVLVLYGKPEIPFFSRAAFLQFIIAQGGICVLATRIRVKAENDARAFQAGLVHASKLSSMGQMSASIAHEINNPVMAILLKIEELREGLNQDAQDKSAALKLLGQIESTTERIAATVKGLREVSRESSHDPFEAVPFRSILENTTAVTAEIIKRNQIRLELPATTTHLPTLHCRPGEVGQILLNLLSNATDALGLSPLKEKWIRIEVDETDSAIHVRVMDNGPGVPPAIEARLFEPFVTGKPAGKGIGIGLNISRTLMERHGGTLELLRSQNPTTFELTFPKA